MVSFLAKMKVKKLKVLLKSAIFVFVFNLFLLFQNS